MTGISNAHTLKLLLHAALATKDLARSTVHVACDMPSRLYIATVTGVKDGDQVIAMFCIDGHRDVHMAPVHDYQLDSRMGVELADLIGDWIEA